MPASPRITSTAGAAVLAALLLAACDKPAPAAKASPGTAGVAASRDDGATAVQVAASARAGLSCPARIATPARAEGAPVDDAMGVRPGLSYDEATNAVLCTHELLVVTPEAGRGFRIKDQGMKLRQGFSARFAEPRLVRSGKQIVQDMQREATARSLNSVREELQPGQSKWYVGTMGVPGQERVISVGREERYANEQAPTVDAVRAALRKKYGAPTHERGATPTQMPTLRWAHDAAGRPVGEGAPLFFRCVGHPDPNVGTSVNPECGVVVEALLIPQKTNPDLVDRLMVSIVDQGGGHRAIAATEQALAQGDAQRRAQEVEKSAKTAKGPTL